MLKNVANNFILFLIEQLLDISKFVKLVNIIYRNSIYTIRVPRRRTFSHILSPIHARAPRLKNKICISRDLNSAVGGRK